MQPEKHLLQTVYHGGPPQRVPRREELLNAEHENKKQTIGDMA
jgi:hypothetical protein